MREMEQEDYANIEVPAPLDGEDLVANGEQEIAGESIFD